MGQNRTLISKTLSGGQGAVHTHKAHTYVKVCEEEPSVTCMKYIDFKMVSFNTEIYLKDTSYFFFLNEVTLSKAVMPAVCWS